MRVRRGKKRTRKEKYYQKNAMDVEEKETRGEKIRTIRRKGGDGRMNGIQDKERGRKEGKDGYKKGNVDQVYGKRRMRRKESK
jgi:hypothetical protein